MGWKAVPLCAARDLCCKVCLQDGGQSFTWENVDECTWFNVIDGWCVVVRSALDTVQLYIREEDMPHAAQIESAMRRYLRLDQDLAALYGRWMERDPKFPKQTQGVRLLRQDPLETLLAFICSQNNAIGRIKQLVTRLKREFGCLQATQPFEGTILHFYQFPEGIEGLLGAEASLRAWKFGYRAKYLQGTAQRLQAAGYARSRDLEALRQWPYRDVLRFLTELPGVGRKVADCIALMSLEQLAVVPVDTHIWRVACERYRFPGVPTARAGKTGTLTAAAYEAIHTGFRELFGDTAGWAHSVLFTAELRPFRK